MNALEEELTKELLGIGVTPDFSSSLASYAINRLHRLMRNEAGPWKYQTARAKSREHPLNKLISELERAESALALCYRLAEEHGRRDEVNACDDFIENTIAATGQDPTALVRTMKALAESAITSGKKRPAGRPTDLILDQFIHSTLLLARAHDIWDAERAQGFATKCVRLLASGKQERADNLQARIERVFASVHAFYESLL